LHASSYNFDPSKFFQTKGLNITFNNNQEEEKTGKLEMDEKQFEKFTETLLSMPIIFGQAGDERYSLPVGGRSKFKERLFPIREDLK
jgi:hypothetical protein